MNNLDDKLYTVAEVAKKLRVNPNKVYDIIRSGHLPTLKLGQFKIRRVALIEFMEKYEGYDLSDLDNIVKLEYTNLLTDTEATDQTESKVIQ